ncbi:MAG TPA: fasciclin domain-containing protein [Blastocatellia bacterium]|nr:fasciclin domain-containing protein [Blastocatellia bacterium]
MLLSFAATVTSDAGTGQQPTQPPARARPAPAPIVTSYTNAADTIIETSIATGQFRKLVSAIQFAEMVDALKADGPFTVFAPSDEAFARLPKEKTDALFADRDKMRMFLNSYVVRGKVMAADKLKAAKPVKEFPDMFTFPAESVVAIAPARTVAGNLLAIRSQAGAHTLGGAKIARADILCSNGIIHVIDTIALP